MTDNKPPTAAQVAKLAKKYPHLYALLVKADPDLPRWIFDNLVNKKL